MLSLSPNRVKALKEIMYVMQFLSTSTVIYHLIYIINSSGQYQSESVISDSNYQQSDYV